MPEAAEVDRGDFVDEVVEEKEVVEPEVVEPEVVEETPEELTETESRKKPPEKGQWIPKTRFDEAVQKERAKLDAERAKVAELEEKQKTQTVSEDISQAQAWIKEMVRKRNNLLADGELEKAAEIDDKIFEVQDAIADRRAEARANASKDAAKSEIQYDSAVARMEEMYPQINPDSEDYDEEAVADIRSLMAGYQTELRMSSAKALEKAAKRIFGEVRKADVAEVVDSGMRRKQEAVKRNVAAAAAQPPSTKDVGLDHDKKGGGMDAKTVMRLGYDEFNKLSDDVLAKLRGDEL